MVEPDPVSVPGFWNWIRICPLGNRIASKVRPGEIVLVPFCGVGPFAVPLAAKGAAVFALETNPEACRWLAENARLNRVEESVVIIKGDAAGFWGNIEVISL